MKNTKIYFTALVLSAIFAVSFSDVFAGSDIGTTLKCYDESFYKSTEDSTGSTGEDEDGGFIIWPTGN